MNLVVDASVALKWFFRACNEEEHTDRALSILTAIDDGRIQMLQPPHFLAEMAAVLTRKKPNDAQDDLIDLQNIVWQVVESADIYTNAVELSVHLQHHLFDTLYHATAYMLSEATLVTADHCYYNRAQKEGRVVLLADFELSGPA